MASFERAYRFPAGWGLRFAKVDAFQRALGGNVRRVIRLDERDQVFDMGKGQARHGVGAAIE